MRFLLAVPHTITLLLDRICWNSALQSCRPGTAGHDRLAVIYLGAGIERIWWV